MSNAPATAAQITTHDEFVAFYVENISDFAIEEIGEDLVVSARAGSYYDAEFVAMRNAHIARLEALSNQELAAEYVANQEAHDRLTVDEDWSEYDVDDYEAYYAEQWLIQCLLEDRGIKERYCSGPVPLTYKPFAALAGVAA